MLEQGEHLDKAGSRWNEKVDSQSQKGPKNKCRLKYLRNSKMATGHLLLRRQGLLPLMRTSKLPLPLYRILKSRENQREKKRWSRPSKPGWNRQQEVHKLSRQKIRKSLNKCKRMTYLVFVGKTLEEVHEKQRRKRWRNARKRLKKKCQIRSHWKITSREDKWLLRSKKSLMYSRKRS